MLSSLLLSCLIRKFGYLELDGLPHKLMRTCSRLPLVAPICGVSSKPWGLAWLTVAAEASCPLDAIGEAGRPLLRLPSHGGGWSSEPCVTKDAGAWLRAMVTKLSAPQAVQHVEPPSAHSMKPTTLSFLAKWGASEADRLVLGHYADTSGSLAVYSRDLQAKPLRALEQCLDAIRRKVFLLEISRSGYFVVDKGIVGGDETLGPAQSLDELAPSLFLEPSGPRLPLGPQSSHEGSWAHVESATDPAVEDADGAVCEPTPPPSPSFSPAAGSGQEEVVSIGDAEVGRSGGEDASSSSSSSSSTSEHEDSLRAPPQALQPPVPWRAGCVVWRHLKTRKLHLVGEADSRLEAAFCCGREISSAYMLHC